ncbi:hypothetical protein N7461_002357 [Penicillium sp. DV-2018c]|nr:hypothetical protein N7461_002357 [Penicillium sp. DV-2018c]
MCTTAVLLEERMAPMKEPLVQSNLGTASCLVAVKAETKWRKCNHPELAGRYRFVYSKRPLARSRVGLWHVHRVSSFRFFGQIAVTKVPADFPPSWCNFCKAFNGNLSFSQKPQLCVSQSSRWVWLMNISPPGQFINCSAAGVAQLRWRPVGWNTDGFGLANRRSSGSRETIAARPSKSAFHQAHEQDSMLSERSKYRDPTGRCSSLWHIGKTWILVTIIRPEIVSKKSGFRSMWLHSEVVNGLC